MGFSWRTIDVGGYTPSERHLVIRDRTRDPDVALPLCVVAPGFLTTSSFYGEPEKREDLDRLARTGFVVVCPDLGGGSTWGNEAFIDAANEVIDWAEAEHNVLTDRVSWIGDSMGAAGVLNWAQRYPGRTGALILRTGAVSLGGIVTRNPLGLAPVVTGAHSALGDWDDVQAYVDPALSTADHARHAGRTFVLFSDNDPIIAGDDEDFGHDTTSRTRSMGALAHDSDAIHAIGIPQHEEVSFILQRHRASSVVPQVQAEEQRWYELALFDPPFQYRAGDVTDATVLPNGYVAWVGADLFGGSISVDPTGVATFGAVLPNDNGIIVQDAEGNWLHQIYRTGSSGITVQPDQMVFPASYIYWPLASIMDDGHLNMLCVLADRAIAPGARIDSHVVRLDVDAIIAGDNTVVVDISAVGVDDIYFPTAVEDGDDGFLYIVSSWFAPLFEGDPNTQYRLARAPKDALWDVPLWRHWTGSGWSADRSQAAPLADLAGQPLASGDPGIRRFANGRWMLVAQDPDGPNLQQWTALSPTGPWTLYARTVTRDIGLLLNSQTRIGQFAKPIPHLAAPPGQVLVSLPLNHINPTHTVQNFLSDQLVRSWTQRFVSARLPG